MRPVAAAWGRTTRQKPAFRAALSSPCAARDKNLDRVATSACLVSQEALFVGTQYVLPLFIHCPPTHPNGNVAVSEIHRDADLQSRPIRADRPVLRPDGF